MVTKGILAMSAALLLNIGMVGQVPTHFIDMNNLPNAAQLYLVYCLHTNKPCVTVKSLCWGQCGNQQSADEMGYGCFGDVEGTIPHGYHYAKWYAVDFQSGRKVGGSADKGFDTRECHNPR